MAQNYTAGVIAHEFQHMLFFNEKVLAGRYYIDDLWINEGFSGLAEDIAGYGFEQGVSWFKEASFFDEPWSTSLINWRHSPSDYGASNLFVRYLYDNFGRDILASISRSGADPRTAIENYTGLSFAEIFENWSLALLSENLELGLGEMDAKYAFSDNISLSHLNLRGANLATSDEWSDWDIVGWGVSYKRISAGEGGELEIEIKDAAVSGYFRKAVLRWGN